MIKIRSAFFVALGYISKILFGFYIFLSAGRNLKNDMFAVFTQHLTFFAIISLLSLFGAGNYLVKKFSKRIIDIALFNSVVLNFVSAFVFCVFLFGCRDFLERNVFYHSHNIYFYIYFSIIYLIVGFNQIISSYFISKLEYKKNSYANVISLAISVPLIHGTLFFFGDGAYLYGFTFFYVILFFVSLTYFLLDRKICFRNSRILKSLVFRWDFYKGALGFSVPVWIGVFSLPILGLYIRDKYVEFYGLNNLSLWQAGVKISDLLQQFIGIFISQLVFPLLIKNGSHSGSLIRKLFVYLFLLFLCIFCVSIFFSPKIFEYTMGASFIESGKFLSYYIWGEFFRSISLAMVYRELSKGRIRTSILFEIMQGLVIFSLSMLLMGGNKFSIAYAYLLSCMTCCFIVALALRFDSDK